MNASATAADPSAHLKRVLSPLQIGPVTLKNRIVRTGHGTGFGKGTMSPDLIDYHVARAKGGVGLTIIEAMGVGSSVYPFLFSGAPGLLEGYRSLMEQVRPFDMKVFQQLGHLGNEIPEADGSPPWSASDTVGALVGVQSQAMTHAQIDRLLECYVRAARDCERGELDGIEVHMAHGYLVQQFLSPLFNMRKDEYGGSFENRMRLAVRILQAVRAEVSPRLAVGVRLSPELLPGGLTPEDVAQIAQKFCQLGLADYVNLTLGTDYNFHKIIAAMHEPAGYEVPYAAPVKALVDVPVLVTGRIRTLQEAEQILAAGSADMVAMTRAHIADPAIVSKTLDGRADEVRPCIGCNHGCIGGLMTSGRVGCTVNVAVGQEASLSEDLIQTAASPKRVLVVGAGPAGLEAARVAALRGHRVILAEASSTLGGCVSIAARAPRRAGIADIIYWLEAEVQRLKVDIRTGEYVEAADVAGYNADLIIVATGSTPRLDGRQHLRPGLLASGMQHSHVVSSHDLLTAPTDRDWGRTAVVYDDVGHYEGVAAAEFLATRAVAVTYVTGHGSFAPRLEPSLSALPALERLAQFDFQLLTYAHLESIDKDSVQVGRTYGGPIQLAADTVVFISHNACNRQLLDDLSDSGVPVKAVGDVLSPRFMQVAIREGHFAARGIE